MAITSNLYGEEYFAWQSKVGKFGAWANRFKFENSVRQEFLVIDYGCGGGFLLEELHKGEKIGIEPNVQAAKSIRFENYRSIKETKENLNGRLADLIISNHALEHSNDPLGDLIALRSLLKPGGIIHLVVPCESIKMKYFESDVNHHIFTFAPINLGNILKISGFKVQKVETLMHKWPPGYQLISKFGPRIFNFACKLWARVDRRWFQVVGIGINEGTYQGH
jgi:SAM-dependent methyltransferase